MTTFTIGLIDAFACAADVLTFYQERLANESYLRTAVERISLQEMGKLVGYRLRPGVAAETWLAFALETPPAPPSNLAPEPGNFVTGVPHSLTLETGLKVQSVPGPDEKPQTFETGRGAGRCAARLERDPALALRAAFSRARRDRRRGSRASPPTETGRRAAVRRRVPTSTDQQRQLGLPQADHRCGT